MAAWRCGSIPLPGTKQNDSMKEIDQTISDVVTGRPHEFRLGRKSYRLYPLTLAKMLLLGRLMEGLSVSMEQMKASPYLETLRLAKEKRGTCCRILAYHTAPNTYRDLFDTRSVTVRENAFREGLDDEDLAALMILVLTADKTEAVMAHYGLDRERERLHRITEVKRRHNKGCVSVGGVTVFGAFIARLKEMGYADDEILYEKGYSYLRLMLADKAVDAILSEGEMGELYEADGGTRMDAGDPRSADKVRAFLSKRGVKETEDNR